MEVATLLQNCYKVIKEVQSIRCALKFHKEKGNELADRLALLEEHLKTIQEGADSHQASTAAKALCKLQGHLVKAYEVLLKCRKGVILRILSYGSIRDEIVDVNVSISTCLGDFAFFNSLPQTTQKEWQQLLQRLNNMAPLKKEELESDAIPRDVLYEVSDASDAAARSHALRAARARGLVSDADLTDFSDEVFVQTETDRESVNALLREMGEEVRAAQLGKAAQEESDLQEICRLIQLLEQKEGSSSGTGNSSRGLGSSSGGPGSFSGDPPPEYLCPITGQLMVDPVVLIETGQTYERAAIERWLSKRTTCPRTNQSVRSTLCAPVVQLRSLIREWADRAGVRLEQPVYQTNSLTRSIQSLSIAPGPSFANPPVYTTANQSQSPTNPPVNTAVNQTQSLTNPLVNAAAAHSQAGRNNIAAGGSQSPSNEPPQTDPVAQYNTGMAHYQGVPQNLPRAIACFHVAVQQRPTFPEALYMLGTCYKLQNDRNEALKCFRAAAGQRFAPAQYQLGVMLSGNEGLGFLQAASQAGVADAQNALGEFYQGKKKYDVARGYWAQAAGQGHAAAQYWLGVCYLEGKGTKKDINQAFQWLQKASAGGHTGATKKLKIFK